MRPVKKTLLEPPTSHVERLFSSLILIIALLKIDLLLVARVEFNKLFPVNAAIIMTKFNRKFLDQSISSFIIG